MFPLGCLVISSHKMATQGKKLSKGIWVESVRFAMPCLKQVEEFHLRFGSKHDEDWFGAWIKTTVTRHPFTDQIKKTSDMKYAVAFQIYKWIP